ncbi:hypothetical protein P168DRAFT_322297 [Aspergillus campestris IBT 28561]|uniref:Cysteine-rich transmembrane CYSTM domain-containing protein n=1 Tax=Aspergillus campestris (strain IBT 28561) TaxID=1392248 RepID=A0A2I1CRI1_ASPC2|nr:uncharacterized protein P168DRAFT_322297 [Aspergillus campestris IBT 28561]PKY00233.1 hypothetical protein P168DRAFT_322297 [Aspergillus campestris IBT 28561]
MSYQQPPPGQYYPPPGGYAPPPPQPMQYQQAPPPEPSKDRGCLMGWSYHGYVLLFPVRGGLRVLR